MRMTRVITNILLCVVVIALLSQFKIHFHLLPEAITENFIQTEVRGEVDARPVVIDYNSSQFLNLPSNTTILPKKTVAYAISVITCENEGRYRSMNAAGLVDASLVMRHSIHNISSRNPDSQSQYNYKMFAIVHKQAEDCAAGLKELGYEVLVVDPPLVKQDIQGKFLRRTIWTEFCCGAEEFVKLYAFLLPAEIIVHVDIDFLFNKPMDHLFDAILYEKESLEGIEARSKLEVERYSNPNVTTLPDKIGAFITRDWHQVSPGKWPSGFQAGFMVVRRDTDIFKEIIDVIIEGNYTDGWGWNYGWGSKGYGGWIGAKAMQGVIAYFVDHIHKDWAVELNSCRYNHLGADVRFNAPPNWRPTLVDKQGKCRNNLGDNCEDCLVTDIENIYSIHYAACGKPWMCTDLPTVNTLTKADPIFKIDIRTVYLDHCLGLLEKWHAHRADFEEKLQMVLTNNDEYNVLQASNGEYNTAVFHGHCKGVGKTNYTAMDLTSEAISKLEHLYNSHS